MQVSAHWLRHYIAGNPTTEQITERLVMSLSEVDRMQTMEHLSGIMVGEITAVDRHPNADSLWVTKTSVGRRTYQIVCGANNLFVGAKVPVALVGTTLPDGITITRRTIRGKVSEGMLCSPRELALGEDHSGIWLLPADSVSGRSLHQALAGRFDTFELDVPANRPDCLGHMGIAREAAAALRIGFRPPQLRTTARSKSGPWNVTVNQRTGCRRYSLAYLTGLTNQSSPDWLQQRLTAVGVRPISAIVDITNYVMLETGQPLHAFDAERLDGRTISVRHAKPREAVRTLDGQTRRAPSGAVVIADRRGPLGFAGIMGGEDSQVRETTTAIVLEAASFSASQVRRTSRALGLRSESSSRFERSPAASQTWPAVRRAIDLLQEICGGQLAQLSDTYPQPERPPVITCDVASLSAVLGVVVAPAAVKRYLERLGCTVSGRGNRRQVRVPSWRSDLTLSEDLYEEVARQLGYDQIPATMPQATLDVPTQPVLWPLAWRLRDWLVQGGLSEVVTHSLVGDTLLKRTDTAQRGLVAMANPFSADHRYLRASMLPRHLESVADNLRRSDPLAFFEIGRVFHRGTKTTTRPPEREQLMITVAGKQDGDVLARVRAIWEYLSNCLHLNPIRVRFRDQLQAPCASGRRFRIEYAGSVLGWIGEYAHPHRLKARGVAMLEVDLAALHEVMPTAWQVPPTPRFPAVERDLSCVLPATVTFQRISQFIVQSQPLITAVDYVGSYAAEGSMTIRITFRADNRTLTDQEVNTVMTQLVTALKQRGVQIR